MSTPGFGLGRQQHHARPAYAGKRAQAVSDVSGRDGVHALDSGPQMWMPMEASALSTWRWVDWLRFFFYRRGGPVVAGLMRALPLDFMQRLGCYNRLIRATTAIQQALHPLT